MLYVLSSVCEHGSYAFYGGYANLKNAYDANKVAIEEGYNNICILKIEEGETVFKKEHNEVKMNEATCDQTQIADEIRGSIYIARYMDDDDEVCGSYKYFTTPKKAVQSNHMDNALCQIFEYQIGTEIINNLNVINNYLIWSNYYYINENNNKTTQWKTDVESQWDEKCWRPGYREYNAIIIQKYVRGLLGRRYATDLKYKPDGPGFKEAEQEFCRLARLCRGNNHSHN